MSIIGLFLVIILIDASENNEISLIKLTLFKFILCIVTNGRIFLITGKSTIPHIHATPQ